MDGGALEPSDGESGAVEIHKECGELDSMATPRMLSPGRFDASALCEAMDARRRSLGLSWAQVPRRSG
jgi:hypothetical protein